MIDPKDLENQLQEALKECASLREENERLKKLLGSRLGDLASTPKPIVSEPSAAYTSVNQVTNDSPIETQIALFRSLFRGREDANTNISTLMRFEKGSRENSPTSRLLCSQCLRMMRIYPRRSRAWVGTTAEKIAH